ncbi:PLP-dependent cysteine synthase family protein [Naumannella halotolerans]|uniref:PLP-dependent cysteine synthase family protein n=1 Tax=Naumannella halotolerans TaxID=993414 RepID=UPI00370D711D
MTTIATSITDLIGHTPLLELQKYSTNRGLRARLLAKLEYLNPLGSVKDRTAWSIIRQAEESGALQPGGTIVDVTSGNTGISLAAIAARHGYRTKFYLSDNISPDKITLLQAFGADVVTVPNVNFADPPFLATLVERIRTENPDAYFTDQLANPANPQAHYSTTGPEIWADTDGQVDILVTGVGTGGTVTGTAKYLREHNPDLQVVLAEPGLGSLPTEENPYPHEIDGVHKVTEVETEYLPDNFDPAAPTEVIALETADARTAAQALAAEEGLLIGTSAGAITWVATQLAQRPENAGKTIVAVLPDSGERYLAAGTFATASAQTDGRVPQPA